MKNKNNKSRNPVFIPYGLEIPKSEIFDSARNLGVAIAGALTSTPPEDIEINKAHISIGLGCFSFVGVSISKEDAEGFEDESLDVEFERCRISSAINYEIAETDYLLFISINVNNLIDFSAEKTSAIQFLGPERLLKKIKSDDQDMQVFACDALNIGHYLEYGMEPNNTILTPTLQEYKIVFAEKDQEKRFRMLMNMITSFYSKISAKLLSAGTVDPSSVIMFSDDALKESLWFKDETLGKPWVPCMKDVELTMERFNMKKKDVCPSVRKLLWQKGRIGKNGGDKNGVFKGQMHFIQKEN